MITAAERQAMVQFLNTYAFLNIWNQTSAEDRVNTVLKRANSRMVKGNVGFGLANIPLPAGGPYAVFSTSIDYFGGVVRIDAGAWTTTEDILNQDGVILYVYDAGGRQMPRRVTHLYRVPGNSRVMLVAIEARAYWKAFGVTPIKEEMYITAYRDSDAAAQVSSWSYLIPTSGSAAVINQVQSRITACLSENSAGTFLVVNGSDIDPTQAWTPAVGDYIDVVLDRNVMGQFRVNVSDNTTGYASDRYEGDREILHIPKALNPNNFLITHNTLSLYVRDRAANRGVYFHRIDPTCVEQITHNDISVKSSVVQAFRDHLGASTVDVVVKIRRHSKQAALMPEANFLYELYQCSDADILRHLRGELDAALDFWTAAYLEDSWYTKMIMRPLDSDDPNYLDVYMDALGYRSMCTVLSQQVSYKQYDTNVPLMSVQKPFALRDVPVHPLVTLNGKKVRDSFVHCQDSGASSLVSFGSGIVVNGGDEIVIHQVASGRADPIELAISLGNTAHIVPYAYVNVYEVIPLVSPIVGYTGQSEVSYRKVIPQAGSLQVYPQEGGGLELVFGSSFYGKTVIVYNAEFCNTRVIDLASMLTDNLPIIIPLQTNLQDNSGQRPLLGYASVEIYLNNKRLCPGIDYTVDAYTDDADNPAWVEAVIASKEFLDVDGGTNCIEIVAHSSYILSDEAGYVIDNKCSYDNVMNAWYPLNSRGYIMGMCQTGLVNKGEWVEPVGDHNNGEPYLLTTTVPLTIYETLDRMAYVDELQKIGIIDAYLGRTPLPPTVNPSNPGSYNLYSPYLSAIIYAVINETMVFVDDPVDETFLAQFSSFEPLKLRDPSITRSSRVDLGFVDISGHYRTLAVSDGTKRHIIQRILTLVLPTDEYQHGDVLL